jgi:hypothetical protein
MNTVNYNDAEQLFGAVGTSLKEHTAEIADIVNVYGAKNLFNLNDIFSSNRLSISNDVFTNTSTDTRSNIWFYIDAYNSENTKISTLLPSTTINKTGVFVATIEIPANTSYLRIGHNGLVNNIDFKVYFNRVGVYKFSINFIAVDVSTVGGFSFNNIMIRLASIEDGTYVPYVPTNAELLSADTNAVLGAHQFLNCTLASIKSVNTMGTWNDNVYTLNGVTFTINSDLSVSISGTASNNNIFVFKLKEDISLIENKKYSGISGGSSSTIWLLVEYYNNNSWVGEKKIYDGAKALIAPSTANKVNLEVYVKSGASINKTIYPLLSLASDPSTAYAPYAKTNKELTDDIASLAARIKAIEDTNHLTYG